MKQALNGGSERQPEEAARQCGENEEAAEAGRLNERAARLRAEKRARGARTHYPGFRIDPLKDCGVHEPYRIRPRYRFDAACGCRNLP